MAKKEARTPSAKTNLLKALGAITVGDNLSPEIMNKVSELHALLAPPPRKRRKKAAVAEESAPKEEKPKKPAGGFAVKPRPVTETEPFA